MVENLVPPALLFKCELFSAELISALSVFECKTFSTHLYREEAPLRSPILPKNPTQFHEFLLKSCQCPYCRKSQNCVGVWGFYNELFSVRHDWRQISRLNFSNQFFLSLISLRLVEYVILHIFFHSNILWISL